MSDLEDSGDEVSKKNVDNATSSKGKGPGVNASKMKKIGDKRKKDVRNSDSEMSDDGKDNDAFNADGSGKASILDRLKRALHDGAKAFARSFVDYGPPYQIHKDGLELEPCPVVDCVSEMNMSYVKLHRLLNDHMDPNIPDADDFYFTGMHYAGRHLHFLAARMMRRAGAEVNVFNEWGQTPLILTVMNVVAHEKDPRKLRQIKMLNWLIEQGANVSHRDRGGYEAIDFACMNNNLEVIQILMTAGAKLRRDNFQLVAKRGAILEYVSDPDVYRFVLEHLKVEEEKFQARESVKARAKKEIEMDRAAQRNLLALSKRKEEKIKRQKEALEFERTLMRKAARKRNIEIAMNTLTSGKKLKDQGTGEWVPDEQRNWHWEPRSAVRSADEVSKRIHSTAVEKMRKLHSMNKLSVYNERWKQMGGEGKIEAPWTREAEFYMEGVTDGDKEDEAEFADEPDVRDENDDMLAGEDLEEAMELMSMGSNPSKK